MNCLRSTFRRKSGFSLMLLAAAAFLFSNDIHAQGAKSSTGKLKVYFVDVEGGQSTLFVTPEGQSLLIDTGWPGNNYRDADRIAAVAKQAGVSKLDYVLITHYHDDHVGGLPQLVGRIPVGTFIDHGPNRELDNAPTVRGYDAYQKELASGKEKRIQARPGDVLPIKGFTATVISADGALIQNPVPGAGQPNPFCAASETRPADKTENSRSLGIEINFGKIRILDLGDLTWDKEMQLMCPTNKIGHVDVLVVSHHGWYQSSSPALVDAIMPRVAIMDNGAKKGGSTPTLQTLRKIPGLETLWQLHFSDEGGPANNTAAEYIANTPGVEGQSLELVADRNGSFEVVNSRTKMAKNYSAAR